MPIEIDAAVKLLTTMAPFIAAVGVALAVFSSSSLIDAFTTPPPIVSIAVGRRVASTSSSWRHVPNPKIIVRMSGEETVSTGDDSTTGTTVEDSEAPIIITDEDNSTESSSSVEEEEEARKKEIEELKLSITSLESSLKAKKYQLSTIKEQIDKFSAGGYARQVASVENAKRIRGAGMADDKSAARATVLQSFLPAFDELDNLESRYGTNTFAKTLDSGLRSELESSMKGLGVSAYIVEPGQSILDVGRIVAVEQEYSTDYARGTVIRMVKAGLEISGNVIRPVEVVGSLGREEDAALVESEGGGDVGEATTE
jgi:molecular chaperone GrpE (heat shock protein)